MEIHPVVFKCFKMSVALAQKGSTEPLGYNMLFQTLNLLVSACLWAPTVYLPIFIVIHSTVIKTLESKLPHGCARGKSIGFIHLGPWIYSWIKKGNLRSRHDFSWLHTTAGWWLHTYISQSLVWTTWRPNKPKSRLSWTFLHNHLTSNC